MQITPAVARRLAVVAQGLDGRQTAADAAGMLDLVRRITCLQLDPINAVARSHLLVLWSRLGNYDVGMLDELLWKERSLFEYWAHAASIVLTEDYPIHRQRMRNFGRGQSGWSQRIGAWLAANRGLRRKVLNQLRNEGPLPLRSIQSEARGAWRGAGWSNERTVSFMVDALLMRGEIMVSGRIGNQRIWDLAERCLPEWTPREVLSEREAVRRATLRSLATLGVARPRDIAEYFTRGRYPGLPVVLEGLTTKRLVQRVEINGDGFSLPGPWYMRSEDLPLIDELRGDWQPRTTLLSPFDNLVADRKRTETLFDFHFRTEVYVSKAQRKFGYYLLPILRGDRLIGRIDARFDRGSSVLLVNAIYLEDGVPDDQETACAIRGSIEDLGGWLQAREISYGRVPLPWQRLLR
jgi:uncharacterized protein